MIIHTLASTITDNFFYMLIDESEGVAALIDPIDAELATEALKGRNLRLESILITHWHPDHVSGNAALMKRFPDARLIVPKEEEAQIEEMTGVKATSSVAGGDTIDLFDGGEALRVHDVPGHTMGHIAFEAPQGHLFLGDLIFSAGVGHCKFGGDVGTLYNTIQRVMRDFPGETTFYCGHDYTERNAEFALEFEPDNEALRAHLDAAKRAPARTIVPRTLAEERQYNPFLRTDTQSVVQGVKARDQGALWAKHERADQSESESAFYALRDARDNY